MEVSKSDGLLFDLLTGKGEGVVGVSGSATLKKEIDAGGAGGRW